MCVLVVLVVAIWLMLRFVLLLFVVFWFGLCGLVLFRGVCLFWVDLGGVYLPLLCFRFDVLLVTVLFCLVGLGVVGFVCLCGFVLLFVF